MNNKALILLAALAAALLLGACSPNKNNAATRRYQEFITRYNVHYNGDVHMKETLAQMESSYQDDYSRRLYMHPVEARAESSAPQPTGNFDRSIEKAQKAIQIRSIKKRPARKSGRSSDPAYKEWMKREEYNPFLHNSWLMLGKGQYYNGDFLGAASTFFYISRHFKWLPATVTEAKLMQALSYIAMGWQYEAEMILTRIKSDELTAKKLRELYNFAYADFYLHADDYEAAVPYLELAAGEAGGAQRTRLNFLLGQCYARLDRRADAYRAFGAAGSSSSTDYRTKFNARIKQSEVYTGSDIEPEVRALRRMTRYDRNKEYLDQVYYAIGNLYLSRADTAHAIENYILANEKSTRNGVDKAMNQIILGKLYFEQGNYELAQPCYSEAIPQLPTSYPDYNALKRRADVLDELAVYSGNVNLQDSLLRLAAMTPEARMEVIEKIIEDLKKREREEAEAAAREEYLANQAAQGGGLQDDNTQSFTINTDNSWYFYNTATRNAGKTEFQRRWGSRKLEDNWRRRNKNTFSVDDFNDTGSSDDDDDDESAANDSVPEQSPEDAEAAERSRDPHYPEYYLAQIPQTEQDIANSHEIIQEGLYNMGVILKDKLEDFGAARTEFGRLLNDYPDNVYRLDTYYNLYLMYMRQERRDEAETYRLMIVGDFPDSPYGRAMTDPDYLEKLRGADERAEALYEQTYEAYLDNRNGEVHRAYERMIADMPMSKIMPKFMFLHALAYVTENRSEDFNAVLREMLERYPDTDLTPVASAWLRGMARGRQLNTAAENMRGMIWDLRLSNDSTATAAEGPAEFELNPESRQLLVLTYPTDMIDGRLLLYEVARHNFRSFVVRDFDLEPMNFGRLGLLVIKGFDNMAQINHYLRVMADSEGFELPAGTRPVVISEADFQTLITQGRSFEEYFRYREERNYIDAQTDLVPIADVETLEEADAAPLPDDMPPVQDDVSGNGEPAEPEAVENNSAESERIAPSESAEAAVTEPAEPVIPESDGTAAPQTETPVQAGQTLPAPPVSTPVAIPVAAPGTPAAQPMPAPAAPSANPAQIPIPTGSEGDDPLLDE